MLKLELHAAWQSLIAVSVRMQANHPQLHYESRIYRLLQGG